MCSLPCCALHENGAITAIVLQVATFGKLVGQSFEVQFTIAAINTLLTTAGMSDPQRLPACLPEINSSGTEMEKTTLLINIHLGPIDSCLARSVRARSDLEILV